MGAVAGADVAEIGADVVFLVEFVGVRGREVGASCVVVARDIFPFVVLDVAVGEEDIPTVFAEEGVEFVDEIGEEVGVADHLNVVFHDPDGLVTRIEGILEDGEMAERDADHPSGRAVGKVGDAIVLQRLVLPHDGACAGTGGIGAGDGDFVEVLFMGLFGAVAGAPHVEVHAGEEFEAKVIDLFEGQIPSVDGGKAIRGDSVEVELLQRSFEFFRPLIEVDHVDEVDVADRVALCFIGNGFEVQQEAREEENHLKTSG